MGEEDPARSKARQPLSGQPAMETKRPFLTPKTAPFARINESGRKAIRIPFAHSSAAAGDLGGVRVFLEGGIAAVIVFPRTLAQSE